MADPDFIPDNTPDFIPDAPTQSANPPNSILGGAGTRASDLVHGTWNMVTAPPQGAAETIAHYAMPGGLPLLRMAKGYAQSAGQGLSQAADQVQQPGLPNKLRAAVTAVGAINPLTSGSTANINNLEDQGRNREAIGQGAVDILPLALSAARGPLQALASDTDGAAMRGMGVGPGSPKGIRTLEAYKATKPLLKGAENLEDLQSKTVAAKAKIWKPYEQALKNVGMKKVLLPTPGTTQGGVLTTVADLEDMRKETSAQLSTVRSKNPLDQQLAMQKGLNEAELAEKYTRIKAVLDPELRKAGINPEAIRKLHGQVTEIQRRVSGKTTVGQAPQKYGLGKLAEHPLRPSSYPASARDILAGRPLYSGKPTDVNIQEGFR